MMLSKSIGRDIERRIITYFMDLLILSILDHEGSEIGGYDVIQYIHKRFHLLLSSGTVYSCMHAMEREDLLKGRHNGKKRVYTLTQHGKETIRATQKMETRILKFVSNLFQKTSISSLQSLPFPVVSSKE